MKKIILFFLILLTFYSCQPNNIQIYKNLYVGNGGEMFNYPVALLKLNNGDEVIVIQTKIERYAVENNYIIFQGKSMGIKGKVFFALEKDFDDYNFDKKVIGPLSEAQFKQFKIDSKINKVKWK